MNKDSLGDRMKSYYENIPKTKLMRRQPVILRLDGKAFHTFTRGFDRPFDNILIEVMQKTMKYLCENIQGCKLGYCQSDEISLLLVDYENINTAAWFEYEVQKMCSIAASMATFAFNRFFADKLNDWVDTFESWFLTHSPIVEAEEREKMMKLDQAYFKALHKGAMFDARCFSIPKEEVCNYFIWRQQDATRNSIQMVGQAHFSHKELQNKSCNDIQDMLMTQKNINWNEFTVPQKRGTCVTKTFEREVVINFETGETITRLGWGIDENIPIFTQDRNYIDKWVFIQEI